MNESQEPKSEISFPVNFTQPLRGKFPPRHKLQPPLDPDGAYFAPNSLGLSRRQLLAGSAATAGVAYMASQARISSPAVAATSATTGTIADLKHVVVFMQENRSYDHYYGVLKGARGYADKQILEYPDGSNIFTQNYTRGTAFSHGVYTPFHMDSARYNAQNADSLDHSWDGTHQARNQGAWNQWIAAKKPQTMGYFTQDDLPFHYALLSQYTLFDHYFCSLLGPTTPNRLYQWTANIDPFGRAGGPITSNPDNYAPLLSWTTYPELLQTKGISWKVYANDEVGDADKAPYVGDYGDNPLWYFHKYYDSLNASNPQLQALAKNAGLHHGWKPNSGRGHDTAYLLQDFIQDCKNGTLPKVSYIVAPYGWCEHPKASPDYGAHYSQTVIKAIYSNPEIAQSTALIMNYDENDGFFDHLLPPTPEKEYADDFVHDLPIGYGVRVPLILVSPWTRGGWVSSDLSDHTSIIRFLEEFTGVRTPMISRWRRLLSSNLLSAFDFAHPDYRPPVLPDTNVLVKAADADYGKPEVPVPTPGHRVPISLDERSLQHRPGQYRIDANLSLISGNLGVDIINRKDRAAGLSIYPNRQLPFEQIPCTLLSFGHKFWSWPGEDHYDFSVYGPDGFLRRFSGVKGHDPIAVVTSAAPEGIHITLRSTSNTSQRITLSAVDYLVRAQDETIRPHQSVQLLWPVNRYGYYDMKISAIDGKFTQRFAGRTR